jgi:hypothetical protein
MESVLKVMSELFGILRTILTAVGPYLPELIDNLSKYL